MTRAPMFWRNVTACVGPTRPHTWHIPPPAETTGLYAPMAGSLTARRSAVNGPEFFKIDLGDRRARAAARRQGAGCRRSREDSLGRVLVVLFFLALLLLLLLPFLPEREEDRQQRQEHDADRDLVDVLG